MAGAGISKLDELAAAARGCTLCAAVLPLGPRPVFRVSETARLLVISQAPGTKVHASGMPFDDASGDRLRAWMGIGRDKFYDASKIAFMPMGFCYPGRLPNGGDAPPRSECAPEWHDQFLALLPQVELILLVGSYAQRRYLGKGSMTAHVQAGARAGGRFLPLPHPSWRTAGWEAKNPWFGEQILPRLKAEVARLT
ncbi:MAG TPA: uracil-DNA glycosylase family protein [Acidocella sp.]|nr:uracil-DNA glycosylase family protein [Acidocella sp.]